MRAPRARCAGQGLQRPGLDIRGPARWQCLEADAAGIRRVERGAGGDGPVTLSLVADTGAHRPPGGGISEREELNLEFIEAKDGGGGLASTASGRLPGRIERESSTMQAIRSSRKSGTRASETSSSRAAAGPSRWPRGRAWKGVRGLLQAAHEGPDPDASFAHPRSRTVDDEAVAQGA